MKYKLILSPLIFLLLSRFVAAQSFNFDFSDGFQGWSGDFADYPAADSLMYQLTFSRGRLPQPLDTNRFALRISGKNHSDDLFMFIRKKISGLPPNTSYQLRFDVELASQAPTNAVGVGGAPGEGVTLKAGATLFEPARVNSNGFWLMNLDKANQSIPGADMDTMGHVGVSDTTSVFTLISRSNASHLFSINSGPDGSVWICIGTDSGFESTTTLYYSRISLNFTLASDVSKTVKPDEIYFFPNPASRFLQFKAAPEEEGMRFHLRNLMDKILFTGQVFSAFPSALPALPPGVYMLEIPEKGLQKKLLINN